MSLQTAVGCVCVCVLFESRLCTLLMTTVSNRMTSVDNTMWNWDFFCVDLLRLIKH